MIINLPIKLSGLGLRDQLDLSPAAEQNIPFFGGEREVCPPLAKLGSNEEETENRWKPLLEKSRNYNWRGRD